jgi:uncharacterized membrane protein HdeD (DUF308 family)
MTTLPDEQESRGMAIALGTLLALAGLVLLVWPAATTLVLVSVLGVAVITYGCWELYLAFKGTGERSRLWGGVVGAVAVIGGAVIFLSPFVSAAAVGIVIGLYWLVAGAVGLVGAFMEPGHRVVRLFVAVISVVAGLLVIAQPGLSLVALVWFSGAWMVGAGLVMVFSRLFGRRRRLAPS